MSTTACHPARLAPALAFLLAGALPAADTSNSPTQAASSAAAGQSQEYNDVSQPVLEVKGKAVSDYSEDDLVGSYGQPRWSATRRFAEVRMYVIPEGQLDFEYWLFIDTPSTMDKQAARASGTEAKTQLTQQYEVEMGLGYRFQADVYQVYQKNGTSGTNPDGSNNNINLISTKLELRYALADWDKIWANPTLYAEWIAGSNGNADNAEFKVLLSDQLKPGWFWASNLVYQVETGGERETSYEWNSGISYDAIDRKLSVGAEDHIGYVTDLDPNAAGNGYTHDATGHWEVMVGPSIRAYPTPRAHVDLTVFVGCTTYTASTETVLIAGWEF